MKDTLPQELIDYIIQLLQNDKRSLSACSLVHSSWTSASRRMLFQNLHLKTKSMEWTTQDVSDLVNSTPLTKYADFVLSITLTGSQCYEVDFHGHEYTHLPYSVISSVLKNFENLRSLNLCYVTLEMDLGTCVQHTPASASLHKLTFSSHVALMECTLVAFLDSFKSFPHLNTLRINSLEWDSYYEPPFDRCGILPELHTVCLELSDAEESVAALNLLLSIIGHVYIRTLIINALTSSSQGRVVEMLGKIGPSLHSLRIEPLPCYSANLYFSIGSLTNLKNAEIVLHLGLHWQPRDETGGSCQLSSMWHDVLLILSQLASTVETVSFILRNDINCSQDTFRIAAAQVPWNVLCDYLNRLPDLGEFNIVFLEEVRQNDAERFDEDRFMEVLIPRNPWKGEYFRQKLATFHESGRLVIGYKETR